MRHAKKGMTKKVPRTILATSQLFSVRQKMKKPEWKGIAPQNETIGLMSDVIICE